MDLQTQNLITRLWHGKHKNDLVRVWGCSSGEDQGPGLLSWQHAVC